MSIRISDFQCQFEREPLARPFGFKGAYMSEMWQIIVSLDQLDTSVYGMGLGVQNVLWSDPGFFFKSTEAGGNAAMLATTDRALQLASETSFDTPVDLLDQIFENVYRYAQKITGMPELKKTFALNALVPVDNAAWLLYAKSKGISDFGELIPHAYRQVLSEKHKKVMSVPLISYGSPISEVRNIVEQEGFGILKIKLGSPGSQEEMLENDKKRLQAIHENIAELRVPHFSDGKPRYYLDANGRYESKESLLKLLEYARRIGAMDQIMLLEEPFPEELNVSVDDMGVSVVADESAHTVENVRERIDMGYSTMALKPIAKTLSETLKMAAAAHDSQVPCFCADLTVNPVLVDWNKNFAARLTALPGMDAGLLETNGHQNYKNWAEMIRHHPCAGAPWMDADQGVFDLDDDFYNISGGIFMESGHYSNLLNKKSVG